MPTCKTLNDSFEKILSDHREADRRNAGIIEVRGEKETLLDDVMLELDELEETKREERDGRKGLERRLLQTGEEVKARALSRSRWPSSTDVLCFKGGTPGKHKRRRRAKSSQSNDKDRKLTRKHVGSCKDLEEKRLKMEEQPHDCEMKKGDREAARMEQIQANECRRMAVDEKRVELEASHLVVDVEERTGMLAERKKVLSVLSVLVRKLQ